MDMVKAFEIALIEVEKETKSIKQIRIEYLENSDSTKKAVWRFTFLPEGLKEPQLSDLIAIDVNDRTGYVSRINPSDTI